MVQYRRFRNTDPPQLAALWNATFTHRGAARLETSTLLEQQVLAKPYFDPAGLILAEDGNALVGLSHAGFASDAAQTGLNKADGVVCLVGVSPAFRSKGIGRELLRRAEEYLRGQGAQTIQAGPFWPRDPFYLGLYGGSDLPGFLVSDTDAEPFLTQQGYVCRERITVLHRDLSKPLRVADGRFVAHRRRFDLHVASPKHMGSWWQECVFGLIEPQVFVLDDKTTGQPAAQALVWEMEAFSERWHRAAMGILRFQVRPELRRTGVGKFLMTQIVRNLQDQYFEVAEFQVVQGNEAAMRFVQSLEFVAVDEGRVYRRPE